MQPCSTRQTAPHMPVRIQLYHPQILKMLSIFQLIPEGRCSTFRRAEVLQRTVSECQVKARRIRDISSTWLLPNPTIWGKHRTRWGNTPVWDTSGTQRDHLLNTGLLLPTGMDVVYSACSTINWDIIFFSGLLLIHRTQWQSSLLFS